jgi:tetratricopeptide (TPR) repeat protein
MRANYGRVLLDLGDKQQATRELLRAIELDAGNFRAWKILGDCQDKEKAIFSYRRALELDPSYTAARAALQKRQGGDGD